MTLNLDTKKYIPKIFAAVLIATVLLLAMNVRYYQKYADFMPVDAMITDVRQHITSSPSSDNKTSYTTHVTYQYNYAAMPAKRIPQREVNSSNSEKKKAKKLSSKSTRKTRMR